MIKVTVISKAGFEFSNVLSTQAEIDSWLEQEKQRGAWGRDERWALGHTLSTDQQNSALDSRSVVTIAELWQSEELLSQEQIDASLDMRGMLDENGDPVLNEAAEIVKEYKLQAEVTEMEYKLPKEFTVTITDIGDSLAVAALRAQRDRLLTASDWTQLPDADLTAAQLNLHKIYRQALRDLPANTVDSSNPEWPVKP